MSSFSGKIKEFPQISVDRFDGRNLASTAYFLSHAHSDHMVGLSSPQFLDHLESNSGVYLYCDRITARFLQASIRHRPLDPYVRPLQLEEPVKITIPNVAEEVSHQLCVTIISAGHCPGSVMFLFEGKGGTILYTGDFRISVGDVAQLSPLHNVDGTIKSIDSLYIDTTFCHRDIQQFPAKEESAAAVVELVEEWLARGNNHLIHLHCPAKYGYEHLYLTLHEQFGMPIHVSRWKYRMYDTIPEIQDTLTTDATQTWIHACDWRINENDDNEGDGSIRHLPCRCVPYGVDTTPNIRVIKPCAMYYTIYQSQKEIKVKSVKGNEFWRVLLSMHASCNEVLDLVSYLRPRKVYPNVIPAKSSKEEVLRLLHEALNRSGDHYSIEYGGSSSSNQRRPLGSFKRQLQSNESNSSIATLEAVMYDGSSLSSLHKRRRHSDSNMTLILPTPRGNMKGSLSLEGEAARSEMGHPLELEKEDNKNDSAYQSIEKKGMSCNRSSWMLPTGPSSGVGSLESMGAAVEATSLSPPPPRPCTPPPPSGPLIWMDPYTPSPPDKRKVYNPKLPHSSQDEQPIEFSKPLNTNTAKSDLTCSLDTISSEVPTSDNNCSETILRNVIMKVNPSVTTDDACKTVSGAVAGNRLVDVYNKGWQAMSVDNDDDNQSMASYIPTQSSQDSIDLASVFSEDPPDSPQDFRECADPRPCSSAGVAGERGVTGGGESAMKRSRKQWYKHKYFSTPVHEDGDKRRMSPQPTRATFGPRSCSLPLPEPDHREEMVSPDMYDGANSPNMSSLPVITVSSPPSDASCTESQKSDDTNITVVLSTGDGPNDPGCGDSSDCVDPMLVDDAEYSLYGVHVSGATNTTGLATVPVTTTVPTNFSAQVSAKATSITPHLQRPSVICGPPPVTTTTAKTEPPLEVFESSHCHHHRSSLSSLSPSDSSPSDSTSSGRKASLSSPQMVDLVSDSDCTPELEDLLALQGGQVVTQVTGGHHVTQVQLGHVQEVTVNTKDCSSRTSCLKTTRRRDNEVQVVTFDH